MKVKENSKSAIYGIRKSKSSLQSKSLQTVAIETWSNYAIKLSLMQAESFD